MITAYISISLHNSASSKLISKCLLDTTHAFSPSCVGLCGVEVGVGDTKYIGGVASRSLNHVNNLT